MRELIGKAGSRARRLAGGRVVSAATTVLATPYMPRPTGTDVVIPEHYGMLVGIRFSSARSAAEHYFETGWRTGVVPTPFLDAPAARFSEVAALRMRNELAKIARGGDPRARRMGTPSRFIASGDVPGLLGTTGGWLAEITRRASADPERVYVRIGGTPKTWADYLAACEDLRPAARIVLDQRLIDQDFYSSQIGGARALSAEAALDDYLSNGEYDGRMPNLYVEPEWYEAWDRTQVRRGRAINQFLDFVARGEIGEASAHFSGKAYAASLSAAQPVSLLRHYMDHAGVDDPTPASAEVVPVSRSLFERTVRERVAAYHDGLALRDPQGPPLPRHPRIDPSPRLGGTALVFVDERHLRSDRSITELQTVLGSAIDGLRVVVIGQDALPHRADVEALAASDPRVDLHERPAQTRVGAVMRGLVDQVAPDLWTQWMPGQSWHPDLLALVAGALASDDDLAAVAVVAPGLDQRWLSVESALWVDTPGHGVFLRGSGARVMRPDAESDLGILTERIYAIASAGRAGILSKPLMTVTASDDVPANDLRAGGNVARSRHLLRFDGPVREGVGVAIPTFEDWRMTVHAVRRVLATAGDQQVVVSIVDNGSRRPVATVLATCFAGDERVVVKRMPRNTDFALGSNLAAVAAGTDRIVFLNNDTSVLDGWLSPLVDVLDDDEVGAVQPLLLYGDRTVQTAGTIFLSGMSMPRHLYADVHPIDVAGVDEYPFSALTAACLAVRRSDVAALGGFDAHYVNGMEDVDFCLRLIAHRGGSLRVTTASTVVHYESKSVGRLEHQVPNRLRFVERWESELVERLDDRAVYDRGALRLESIRWGKSARSPLWEPTPVLTRPVAEVREAAPRLRWAIKSSATGDLSGDVWGDTFFAEALADALRRAGQEAVVDRASSHTRASVGWDDVTLTLRGLTPFIPQPGAINLIWVISHPDLVTRAELASGFDRRYAAGAAWARQVQHRWDLPVQTMLQATDARRFHPGAGEPGVSHGVLFVGRTRGVPRAIVADAIAVGADPEVYGDDGWEQFIDPVHVRGSGIPNDRVPAAYAGARIVLNDHWTDMAEYGFYSNRLFDAAAVGARVVSDPVAGIEELFGGQVRVYRDREELRRLLDPASTDWPGPDELAALAATAVREHSFDARAATLIADALEIRREKRA